MKKKRSEAEDLEFLEQLMNCDIKEVARHFKISEPAARSWLYRLRRQIVAKQQFLNKVRTYQRISPRVRKLTTIGGVPNDEGETGEDKLLCEQPLEA